MVKAFGECDHRFVSASMQLLIGNKNYSSWSLRAWLLLRQLGVEFTERKVSLNDPAWKSKIKAVSPAGCVPVLIHGDMAIWDTFAIAEYLAESFVDLRIWPEDRAARATARSVSAEMHSGFAQLRTWMPMNIEARLPNRGWSLAVQTDIDRIVDIWTDARARFGQDGPMLFGSFSAADAFFAPVVWRFVTYGVELPEIAQAYVDAVRALEAMKAWQADALAENDWINNAELYRRRPDDQ